MQRAAAADRQHAAHVTRDKTFVVETYDFIQAQTMQQSSRVCARLLAIKNNLRDHFVTFFDQPRHYFYWNARRVWGIHPVCYFLMAAAHEAPPLWQRSNYRGRPRSTDHHTEYES
jgi:hypothetical protein